MGKLLELLLNISPALENGKTLANPKTWGNVANVSHALIIVFGFILVGVKTAGYDIPITDSQLAQIAGGIASVGGTIVAYLNVATSADKGVNK